MTNQWTDQFGDTLSVETAGANVLVCITTEVTEPCVALDFRQQRELVEYVSAHLKRCGQ